MPSELSSGDGKEYLNEKKNERDRRGTEKIIFPRGRGRRDSSSVIEGVTGLETPQNATTSIFSKYNSSGLSWPHAASREERHSFSFKDASYGFALSSPTDVPLREKVHEDENSGFDVEGRYSKNSRELMESSLGSRYLHTDQKLQQWDTRETSLFSTVRYDILSGKSVDHISLHSPHLLSDSESSWDQVQSKERSRNTGVEYSSMDPTVDAQRRASGNDIGRLSENDFEARFDRYGSFSSYYNHVAEAHNHPEDHLGSSVEWKPLKWVRSGNLSSCSSIFGRSGSFKEPRGEMHNHHDIHGKLSAHHSTSKLSDAGNYILPDDETHLQKKQRLGWGQGLAKYEKQKVEGHDDETNKSDLIQCEILLSPKVEEVGCALQTNLYARSPKLTSSSGCGSPVTPYSVICISSPDEHVSSSVAGSNEVFIDDKSCIKASDVISPEVNVADGISDLQSALPILQSYSVLGESSYSVLGESSLESEHLELNPIVATSCMSIDTLHTKDTTLGISGSGSVAAAKLLSLKIDSLQKLEKIECDIEKYEKELKLLNLEISAEDHHVLRTNYLEPDGNCSLEACAEASDKGLGDRYSNALDRDLQAISTMPVLNDGFTASPLDSMENELNQTYLPSELQSTNYHVLISESNTTDTKVVRSQRSEEPFLDIPSMEYQLVRTESRLVDTSAVKSQSSGGLEHAVDKFVTVSTNNEPLKSQLISSEEPRTAVCFEVNKEVAHQSIGMTESRDLVSSILAANKEVAKEASESIGKLLPTVLSETSGVPFSDILDSSLWKQNAVFYEKNRKQMEAKIADRKHFMDFKERALALKFRVHRKLWKEDQLLMPTRRHRLRTQKRSETNCSLSGGHQKYRSSVRSRFAYPDNLTSTPTEEAIQMASKVISNAKDKPYKSILKMPALALNEGEKCVSRFITRNGLVGDPISIEKERTMVNPWTPEERGVFLEKFAAHGKNFSKIASFLEHKTTADCVEFFYKNQKSEDFIQIKKMHKLHNKRDYFCGSTYLATSGNNQHRESNSASLDVLNADSTQAVGIRHTLQKYGGRPLMGMRFDHGRFTSQFFMDTSNRIIIDSDLDSESTAAVDVLAGLCGAFSCEPVGSCVTTTGVDRSESLQEKVFSSQHRKKNADTDHTLTSEAVENIEIQYSSEENCEEINLDWTDDEKALFISAVTMFGKDFRRICHYVHSKTEVQCKTFFSKARKRLGLDELIPHESNISAKRNHGRKDDETGLDKICAVLWDTDTSAKVGEIPYSNASSEAGPNSKAGIVLNDFCEGHHRSEVEDNQKKSNSGDGKASLKEETELKESTNLLQNATEMTSGKAPASPDAQHFWFNRSLMKRREGLHMCSFADTQQKKDNPKVLHADVLWPDESIKSQVIVESYDKTRDFVGDSVEAEDHKPSEAVISCSGKNSFINDMERCHDMVKREVFIDGKAESRKHEEAGSLMEPISSKEDIKLPGNEMREKNPLNVTSQGKMSAGTLKLLTSEPNENSLDHFSLLNSEILSSDTLVNPTTNGSRAALHASDDVSSKEKCLIGSRLTGFGDDPFGMNVTSATRNSKSLVGGKSAGASSTNNVAWKMYLDGKESIRFPVHEQENMPIGTSVVSQFQQKTSDSFSYMPQQMIHCMRPEVVSQQNQHISSLVLSKGHNMFQQKSASSLLVRKRHLDNPMVHHYEIEEECHKIQQQGSSDSELPSQRFRGQLQMVNQTGAHGPNVKVYQQETLPLDSEQSSSLRFGGQQLQMLNNIEAHPHRNVDAYKQEALQQNASDSKLSSQVLAGQQLQVVSREEICREKEIGTYQRAALQHLAQEHYNSQVKSFQQNQIIQPNSDQHMIQKVQNANEEHRSLVSQILQMSNSEQIMELSNQIKQSSLIPEQKQHLHQWQQEYKAHSDICEDYIFPKKTEWQVESHKQLKSQRFESNFNPIMKSIYSSQIPSVPGEIEVKSCPTPVEQTPRRGDVKLFGQNLLSHPSNISKLPPSKNVNSEAIESQQGSCKTFNIQENDEWCLLMATMSSDKQPQTCHSCVHSEDIAASAENTKSGRVHEAVTDIIEHFVHEAQESKQNLAKVGAGYLGQDFGGQNFHSWEGSGGHNLCINSMPVQTGTLPLPQDLNLQFKGNSLVGTSVEQPVNAGRCKEISSNSSAIPLVHGRVIQDVPYPIRDPLTIRHADYHPSVRRDLRCSSFPSLDLKFPECSSEFQKRNGVLDMTMASSKPGKCDTVQSMFAFPSQIRNIFNDTGFQMVGVMPGGTVSDPVNAINMLDSPAEQAPVSVKYPQFTRTGDLESDRGDHSR